MNKDLSRDADLQVTLPISRKTAAVFRLSAPNVESKTGMTFASAEASADGKWLSGPPEKVSVENGSLHLLIPHASAVLVKFGTP